VSATTQQKIPGPDHPITIEPHSGRVVVRAGERVLADTTSALALHEASYPPVLYIPFTDLDASLLVDSETTSYCPYKGTAAYHSIRGDDGVVQDAIWFYPEPYDAVGAIAGHAAFYPDRVTIES
jgi:uncharacterized protein (DUF427 family)